MKPSFPEPKMNSVNCLMPDRKTEFSVRASGIHTGAHLKRIIKQGALHHLERYDAHELTLRLAKRDVSRSGRVFEWLQASDVDFAEVLQNMLNRQDNIVDIHIRLDDDRLALPDLLSFRSRDIHIIVDVPHRAETSVTLLCTRVPLSKQTAAKFAEWVLYYALLLTVITAIVHTMLSVAPEPWKPLLHNVRTQLHHFGGGGYWLLKRVLNWYKDRVQELESGLAARGIQAEGELNP